MTDEELEAEQKWNVMRLAVASNCSNYNDNGLMDTQQGISGGKKSELVVIQIRIVHVF